MSSSFADLMLSVVLGQGLAEDGSLLTRCVRGTVKTLDFAQTRDAFSQPIAVEEEAMSMTLRFAADIAVGQESLTAVQWQLPGSLEKPDAASCGTAYVSSMERGGRLSVNVTFRFSSAAARIRFRKETQMDQANLLTLGGFLARRIRSDGEMRLQVVQSGGKPEQLNKLLPQTGSPLSCTIARPESCVKLLDNLLHYGISPQGFWGQLREAWQSRRTEDLMVLRYSPTVY